MAYAPPRAPQPNAFMSRRPVGGDVVMILAKSFCWGFVGLAVPALFVLTAKAMVQNAKAANANAPQQAQDLAAHQAALDRKARYRDLDDDVLKDGDRPGADDNAAVEGDLVAAAEGTVPDHVPAEFYVSAPSTAGKVPTDFELAC